MSEAAAAGRRARGAPAWWLAALLAAWAAAVLALNLPGHLSYDSLVQIAEGRSGVYESWNPVFISAVFGALVAASGGTGVLVAVSTLALGASVWLIVSDARGGGPAAIALTGALLFTPILLIYPAIVWKDVWFAHASLLGFALVQARRRLPSALVELAALALFSFALLSRQTGIIVALVGVAALSTSSATGARGAGRRSRAVGFLARLGVLLAISAALSFAVNATAKRIAGAPVFTGIRLVATFDLAGILARDPAAHLDRFAAHGVLVAPIEKAARELYTPDRIDTLDLPMTQEFSDLTAAQFIAQWADLVRKHPLAYLAHRGEFAAWLYGLRDRGRCVPVFVGYGPEPLLERAGIGAPPSPHADALARYASAFERVPCFFSPLFWGLASLLVLAVLWRRRQLAEPVAMLQVAGLLYLASYLPIGLACDFRYTYFSVVAAAVGLMYAAAGQPPGRR